MQSAGAGLMSEVWQFNFSTRLVWHVIPWRKIDELNLLILFRRWTLLDNGKQCPAEAASHSMILCGWVVKIKNCYLIKYHQMSFDVFTTQFQKEQVCDNFFRETLIVWGGTGYPFGERCRCVFFIYIWLLLKPSCFAAINFMRFTSQVVLGTI